MSRIRRTLLAALVFAASPIALGAGVQLLVGWWTVAVAACALGVGLVLGWTLLAHPHSWLRWSLAGALTGFAAYALPVVYGAYVLNRGGYHGGMEDGLLLSGFLLFGMATAVLNGLLGGALAYWHRRTNRSYH